MNLKSLRSNYIQNVKIGDPHKRANLSLQIQQVVMF